MRTIKVGTSGYLGILSAYAAAHQQLSAVEESPGWYVIGAFFMPQTAPIRLELIGLVDTQGNVLRARLFDVKLGAVVSGSVAEVGELVDTRVQSGVVELVGNRVYQMQAEVIGPSGSGIVRTCSIN